LIRAQWVGIVRGFSKTVGTSNPIADHLGVLDQYIPIPPTVASKSET
jgi:hypothetical protein